MRASTVLVVAMACSNAPSTDHSSNTAPEKIAKAAVFSCYKSVVGGWRECLPAPKDCDKHGGCFDRTDAYCVPFTIQTFETDPVEHALMCTPTQSECEAFHEERRMQRNHPEGPCVLSKADEYFEPHK